MPPQTGTIGSAAAAMCRHMGRAHVVPRNGPDTEPAAAKTQGAEQIARRAIIPPLEKPTT